MTKAFLFIFLFSFKLNTALGNNCSQHSIHDPSVPLCPVGGGVLPETYPVKMALVATATGGKAYAQTFVSELFSAQKEKPPYVVVSVSSDEECTAVKTYVRQQAPEQHRNTWVSNIDCNKASNWNWQQDFAQSYVNRSGIPVVRFNPQYYGGSGQDTYRGLQPLIRRCGFLVNNLGQGQSNSAMGGNIESIPPDICVIGDSVKSEGVDPSTLCPNENKLYAPTNFMQVGHTDEIMKTVQTGSPPPCNFKILIGDVSLAGELLQKAPQENFIPNPSRDHFSYCGRGRHLRTLPDPSSPPSRPDSIDGHLIKPLKKMISFLSLKKAYANLAPITEEICSPQDFYNGYMDQHREINALADRQLDQFAKNVEAEISKRLPQCSSSVMRVPMLFHSRHTTDAVSEFPNPTNGLSLRNHVIFPEQNNKVFDQYLNQLSAQIGVTSSRVDTAFAHKNQGNLHCSSNLIRYCRPRPKN